jgi:hypothetical protein
MKAQSKPWLFLSLFGILAISCGKNNQGTKLRITVPNGTWGYFIVRPSENDTKGGTIDVKVPMDGMGPEVPENPYRFEIRFEDGTPIYSVDSDPRLNVPDPDPNMVQFMWPQMPDTRGHLFFVGTEKQFQQTYKQNPPIGLKKIK